jgi:ribosomal protein L21E
VRGGEWAAETGIAVSPVVAFGIPHPRYFGKRGCKLVKTKDRSRKKKVKRLQAIDKTRVSAAATGQVREVFSR